MSRLRQVIGATADDKTTLPQLESHGVKDVRVGVLGPPENSNIISDTFRRIHQPSK